MAYDELLRLSGTTNDPEETITASGNGTPKYFGKSVSFRAELRVGGSVGGTNPTLDIILQAGSTSAMSDAVTIGTFPQQTASDILDEGEPADADSPTSENIAVIGCATPYNKPYVRIVKTVGGTGAVSFGSVSVVVDAINGPFAT